MKKISASIIIFIVTSFFAFAGKITMDVIDLRANLQTIKETPEQFHQVDKRVTKIEDSLIIMKEDIKEIKQDVKQLIRRK